jgi:hypothetical protein
VLHHTAHDARNAKTLAVEVLAPGWTMGAADDEHQSGGRRRHAAYRWLTLRRDAQRG